MEKDSAFYEGSLKYWEVSLLAGLITANNLTYF